MSTHRYIDRICWAVMALILCLTLVLLGTQASGDDTAGIAMEYETLLFDTSKVHTLDIEMDDWDSFIDSCESEEYSLCTVAIDGETYSNVGIRAKGNTSLSAVEAYGNDRYSFKIEFDHYNSAQNYHGLDKLSLNNIIQDNTYMKDYLCYRMMASIGVAAPLCSYAYITVNGEDWGLYLAVEGVEESFLERNYGADYGELYKPDSMELGGGRGNGWEFDAQQMDAAPEEPGTDSGNSSADGNAGDMNSDALLPDQPPDGNAPSDFAQSSTSPDTAQAGQAPAGAQGEAPPEGEMFLRNDSGRSDGRTEERPGGSMADDDVSLIYTDDSFDSYTNIFDNAKTDITDSDRERLIASLKALNENTDISSCVDVEQVIRYFVVHNFVCNFDSYTGSMIHNYYLYEQDGQLSMIPWDYNLAFGGFQSGGDATELVNYPIDTPVSGGTVDSRPMLAWIFADAAYTQMYHTYFFDWLVDYFDSGDFEAEIDAVSVMIAPYVERDPTKFCTYEEFQDGAATLKSFCMLRAQSVKGQLDGSIPSTSDGQNTDSSVLVDASDLSVSVMGSMGNTGGREVPEEMSGGMPPQQAGGPGDWDDAFSPRSAGEEDIAAEAG